MAKKKVQKRTDRYAIITHGKAAASFLSSSTKRLKIKRAPESHFSSEERNFLSCKSLDEGKKLYSDLTKEAKKSKQYMEFIPALILKEDEHGFEGLTNEIIIKFKESISKGKAQQIAKSHGLFLEREIKISKNTYLFSSREFPEYALLDLVVNLEKLPEIESVESNNIYSVQPDGYTPNDALIGQLPHINLTECDEGWEFLGDYASDLRGGSPDICIAVFDSNGVDPTHPDLTANLTDGTSKMLVSWDFNNMQAQTVGNLSGDHGTECAGSATAAFDNNRGTAGIAPNCRLIGARLPSTVTGVAMADAWLWAAGIDNGSTTANFPALPSQPADVISNSWGIYGATLPSGGILQTAFDTLTDAGRDGKGTLICFSVGNSGYIDFTTNASLRRMYAAYNRTIAVGASINTNPTSPTNSSNADHNGNTTNLTVQVDTRALYSPYGPSPTLDVVAPSHTAYAGGGVVDPILSTVRVGTGAVDGCSGAATCNDYDVSFGGTSHACPTVAGLLALMLSANPFMHWEEARDILRKTADQIDPSQTNTIGQWTDTDGNGVNDYSQWYGYGRINVYEAVKESFYLNLAYTNNLT